MYATPIRWRVSPGKVYVHMYTISSLNCLIADELTMSARLNLEIGAIIKTRNEFGMKLPVLLSTFGRVAGDLSVLVQCVQLLRHTFTYGPVLYIKMLPNS